MALSLLSVELVQEIAEHLKLPAQAALRTTCSTLCAALDPFVFSTLTIYVGRGTLKRDLSRLRALAAGSTPYSQHARNLYIQEVTPFFWSSGSENDSEMEEEKESWRTGLQEVLGPALNGLNGVQTVRWAGSSLDPEWVADVVVDALTKWQLRELVYESGMTETLPELDRISGAALRRLSVSIPSKPDVDARPLVTLLRNTPKLVSLSLSAPTDLDLDVLWRVLQTNSVHLVELSVTVVSLTLCDYLASYTGLERLVLPSVDASAVSRQLAGMFFERVLRHQSASIVELRLSPHYTSAWSFGTHNVDVLSSLAKLETLEIAVDPEYDDGRLTKNITLLLDMVPQLRALRTLDIETTMDECYRGQFICGNGMMGHYKAVERRMRAAFGRYRYRGGKNSSAEVHATHVPHGRSLRMVEADDADGWVYAQFEGTWRVLQDRERCEVDSDDDSDDDY
ncbi:hypothetical protein HMN09_01108000 [Mycena chlorophos]|uniref:F-box domain-containing protein n=1 Tax=Mycena chlorophos TaxID=658473 RepID=A0A8H6W1Z1_MYCCL|nr:hypothetical protein HMN09_01108000 [Mycena chlorophos]